MSERHEQSVLPEELEKAPPPSVEEWQKFCEQVVKLLDKFRADQKRLRDERADLSSQPNYQDVAGNLITLPNIMVGKKIPVDSIEIKRYYQAVKNNALAEQYFKLIDENNTFKQGEFTSEGAFPEVLNKYFGNEEQVEKDGYSNYREAYIYESAKLLEAERKQETV